jgi:hypothetical protein
MVTINIGFSSMSVKNQWLSKAYVNFTPIAVIKADNTPASSLATVSLRLSIHVSSMFLPPELPSPLSLLDSDPPLRQHFPCYYLAIIIEDNSNGP